MNDDFEKDFKKWCNKVLEKKRAFEKKYPNLKYFKITVKDPQGNFIKRMERDFEKIYAYGIANIETLPKKHRDRAVKLAIDLVAHWLKQLEELGDEGAVEAILKRAGVIKNDVE